MALLKTVYFGRNLSCSSPAAGRRTCFGGSARSLHLLQGVYLQFSRQIFVCRSRSKQVASLSPILKNGARDVLKSFLKKQGINNATASRIIDKTDSFVHYLVSELHSPHKSRYTVVRELSTSEIKALLEEHKDLLEEMVKKFLESSDEEKELVPPQVSYLLELGMGRNFVEELCRKCPRFIYYSLDGKIKPTTEFFLEKGFSIREFGSMVSRYGKLFELDLEEILVPKWNYFLTLDYSKSDLVKFPFYFNYSLEGRIKPRFERMKKCGVRLHLSSMIDVDSVKFERNLCNEMDKLMRSKYSNPLDLDINARISENKPHLPQVSYLLDLGMDLSSIQGIFRKYPAFAYYTAEDKIKPFVDFLLDLGVPKPQICKIINKRPQLCFASLTENIIPCSEYYGSLGIDVASLIVKRPQCFELSIETHIKPITEFFIEKGFNIGELASMATRVSLYTTSLEENLVPKWEFFLTTGYTKSELVMFPQYFFFDLEKRIKPRFQQMSERGLRLRLNALFLYPKSKFESELVRKEIEKSRSLPLDHLEAYLFENCPQCSPQVSYLLDLGMDLSSIQEILPAFSDYTVEDKIKPVVDFLLDLGVPKTEICKIIYKRPELISASLTENIIPCSEYYGSIGINVVSLIIKRPECFESSIETHIKPITEFFLENGFSIGELSIMVTKVSLLRTISLEGNLVPKWEFFLTMGYDKSELVAFPQYFGYHLERRIKPRFQQMRERGVRLSLRMMVAPPDSKFEVNLLQKEIEKSNLDRVETYLFQNCPETFEFFFKEGFSSRQICSMFDRFPNLSTLSPVDVLMPKWEFFLTMGYNKSELVRLPNYFHYDLERWIKPRFQKMRERGVRLSLRSMLDHTDIKLEAKLQKSSPDHLEAYLCQNFPQIVEFFRKEGFSSGEICAMVNKYAILPTLSPEGNLMPKWDYFLKMGYPKLELVKFPNYFGYNLEKRIKRRFERMVEFGIRLPFRSLIGTTSANFEDLIVTWKEQQLEAQDM